MKKVILFCLSIVLLASCGQNAKQQSAEKEVQEIAASEINVMLESAEELIDKDISIKGWVSHVCKHSGRRCFLKNEDGSVSIRVEAGGKINGFNKELTGEQMTVQGVLKVKKLSEQYLDEWQAKVEAASADEDIENGGEDCSAELTNITEMREWMKSKNKDFYPVYYVDGINYEIINE